MSLLIINGPNLNLIGQRETAIYGSMDFMDAMKIWRNEFDTTLHYFQSNVEGEIIDALQKAKAEGIVLNAGGYTHTSVAIRDAIAAISIPVLEVHLSNISAREAFRHTSLITPVCMGCIFGLGLDSYRLAIIQMLRHIELSN